MYAKKTFLIVAVVVLFLIIFFQLFLKDITVDMNMKGEASLSWNPSVEKDIKGYRIYYGENPRTDSCPIGGYVNKIDVGNKTNYKIKNLENNKTYYFSVTSYNQSGKESCFSEEMNKKISIKFLDKVKNIKFKK
jgi:hypothetical protein